MWLWASVSSFKKWLKKVVVKIRLRNVCESFDDREAPESITVFVYRVYSPPDPSNLSKWGSVSL